MSKVVEIPLTRCHPYWNPYLAVSHCFDLDKQGVCPYLVMFSSNWYSGRTQQIDTDDDLMSFMSFFSHILCLMKRLFV